MALINGFTQGVTVFVLLAFVSVLLITTYRHWSESIVHPLILANVVITYFVVAPAAYYTYLWRGPFDQTSLLTALTVQLGAYIVVIWTFYRFESPRLRRAIRGPHRAVNNKQLFWIGVCGFGLGLVFYFYYVLVNGGFMRLLTVTPRTAFQSVPNTGRYRILARIGSFGGLVTALTAIRPAVKAKSLSRLQQFILVGMSGTVVAMAISYRARYLILIPAAYLLVYFHTSGRIKRRHVVGMGAAIILAGSSFTYIEHELIGNAGMRMLIRDTIHLPRFKAFVMIVEAVPDSYPRQWGLTFVTPFLMGMETDILRYGDHVDIIVAGENRPHITLSGMFMGEWYLNFDLVGVIIGSMLYGGLLKVVHQLRWSSSDIIQGVQPVFLVCSSLLIASNINWVTKTILLPIIPPLAAAIGAVMVYQRFVSKYVEAAV